MDFGKEQVGGLQLPQQPEHLGKNFVKVFVEKRDLIAALGFATKKRRELLLRTTVKYYPFSTKVAVLFSTRYLKLDVECPGDIYILQSASEVSASVLSSPTGDTINRCGSPWILKVVQRKLFTRVEHTVA